jgi:putative membrane protein
MMGLASDGSLNQSMNKAKKHYSSLFFLPSFKTAVAVTIGICILAGITSTVFFRSLEGFSIGLLLGVSLFSVNFAMDLALSKVILKDPIFVLRRTMVLSLFSWIFWFIFIALGAVLGAAFGFLWWVKLCLLGFATLLTLRTVVFVSVSSTDFGRRLVAILLQPFACIIPFVVFWASRGVAPIDYLPFLVVSPFITVLSAYYFIRLLDTIGRKKYNVPSINIFKAFMLNWVSALNAPLEEFLEKMGQDADIEVSILKFDAAKPKAALIVPLVHPGPFKNIGSSLLPSLMKEEYEKAYGCDACVPLGLLGHELDAASQTQNHKIINQVLDTKFQASLDQATPFVRYSEGFVAASCQLFGKTAFLSFTLAPKTTEDLPQELGGIVLEEAGKLGLDAVVVNAHNSLTENPEIEASLDTLRDIAVKCLQKAVSQKMYRFEVGSATVHPQEFTLKDGMGTGGITAVAVKVGDQNTAYVILDGNNMVSGMREKIIGALSSAGFHESEVFTTDTHAVSAVVVGARGYHPIGEAIDQDALIKHVTDAAVTAAGNFESCKAGFQRITVPNVRLIGGDFLSSITVLVDQTIQKAKKILVPVFAVEGLLLILLLALL